jgi:hypothetical protein
MDLQPQKGTRYVDDNIKKAEQRAKYTSKTLKKKPENVDHQLQLHDHPS